MGGKFSKERLEETKLALRVLFSATNSGGTDYVESMTPDSRNAVIVIAKQRFAVTMTEWSRPIVVMGQALRCAECLRHGFWRVLTQDGKILLVDAIQGKATHLQGWRCVGGKFYQK